MKIKRLLLLSSLLLFGLATYSSSIIQASAENEGWVEKDLDISRWNAVNPSKNSEVDYVYSEEHGGSYTVEINKSQSCYSGLNINLEDQIEELSKIFGIGEAIGFNFKFVNNISLSSTNTLNLSFDFNDGTSWKILPTQSTTGIPSLYDVDSECQVKIDFSSMPSEENFFEISSFNIGVDGESNSKFVIYDFKCSFSTEAIEKETRVETLNTIGAYGSTFGAYQYGGNSGTTTKLRVISDSDKSKEADNSALEISIAGEGSTKDRFYSSYLQMKNQITSLSLNNPQRISFWVYNSTSFTGGLYFKVNGTEIYSGLLFDEDGETLSFSRNLDFVGFRRFEINLSTAQFKSNEFEIGVWGANNDTKVYLSKFSYIDLQKTKIGYKYLGALTAFNYSEYTSGPSFVYEVIGDCNYSHSSDLTAIHISRNAHTASYYSCVYLQKFGESAEEMNIKKPTLLSIWINSMVSTNSNTGVAFKLKFKDSTLKEVYPININRNLDFTGERNYIIDISTLNIFDVVELEFAVWGDDAAEVYFSDVNIYDGAYATPTETSSQPVVFKENDIIPITCSIEAKMTYSDNKIIFKTIRNSLSGKTYIERIVDDILTDHVSDIQIIATSTETFDHDVANFELVYKDESNLEASYIVDSTSFSGEGAGIFEVDLSTLPYFISNKNITKLRISCDGEDAEVNISVNSLKIKTNPLFNPNDIYSKVICDFEDESTVLDWGISGDSAAIYYKDYDNEAKLGDGCLRYTFSSMNDTNFSWSEIYYNLNDLVVKNADKKIYGLSFWLYNTQYVTSGKFGYWIKVSQTDGNEFEVKFDHVFTELNTNNNLAFTGWQKVQIPLDSTAYNECSYNPGYSKDNERSFDWTKLQYIKFGFWGYYYNAKDGYSAIAKLDDFRFVSGEKIIDESKTYQIEYVLNGGKLPSNAKYSYVEGQAYVLPTPTRAGFIFEGWYLSPSMIGDPISEIQAGSKGSVKLYAAWSKDESYAGRIGLIIGLSCGAALIAGTIVAIIILRKKKKIKA